MPSKKSKDMAGQSQLLQNFMVTVMILEGRHYVWQNMNSAVIIKLDNRKKTTHVQHHTDSPFYNEYFVFEFFSNFEEFLDKNLLITVIKPKSFINKRKILGTFNLDLATVWAQKNHQFFHKWCVLTSPKSDVFGTTGFLKVDVSILAKGESPEYPQNINNDEIEGNLLLPTQDIKERQNANFIFEIYKCENLNFKPNIDVRDTGKLPSNRQDAGPSTYVEVTFAGHSERTNTKKSVSFPIFNDRLIISDYFPPLSQRAKLDIVQDTLKKSIITHYLNLKSISCDNTSGFLPTFGPSYIYLYSEKHLDGYVGSILVSMETELDESAMGPEIKKATIKNIRSVDEDTLFAAETTFLFGTIFEATSITKKFGDKLISFRITLGHIKEERVTTIAGGDGFIINSTLPTKPIHIKKGVYYMDFIDNKPCLQLRSRWPDFRKRLFNSNMIARIASGLKLKLDMIESYLLKPQRHLYYEELDKILLETLDNFTASVKKYIDVISNNYNINHSTKLDGERISMLKFEMNKFLTKTGSLYNNKSRKHVFFKLHSIFSKLENVIEDPQWCYPDIIVWMVSSFKKVAYIRIPARKLIFSPIEEERGENCGQRMILNFKVPGKKLIICQLDILLWLGLEKQLHECISNIPETFRYDGEIATCRTLFSEERHLMLCDLAVEGYTRVQNQVRNFPTFITSLSGDKLLQWCHGAPGFIRLNAHVFEGKLQPGYDSHGLADGFVQITVADRLKESTVISNSLSPMWDQTLELHNIVVYGSREYIRENPPMVNIQLYDRDKCSVELIGGNCVRPIVLFLDEPIRDDPVKLRWIKMYYGADAKAEVLAIFELIEIPREAAEEETESIISIPQEIRPHLVPFRIEILFWGIRGMKKTIHRPKVTLLCGNSLLNSEVIENTKKSLNFPDPVKALDLVMPSEIEYAHNIRFRLYDSKCFGIYALAGVHACDSTSFFFEPLTRIERKVKLATLKSHSDSISTVVSFESDDKFKKQLTFKEIYQKKYRFSCRKIFCGFCNFMKNLKSKSKGDRLSQYSLLSGKSDIKKSIEEKEIEADFDWWTKFYASIEIPTQPCDNIQCNRDHLLLQQRHRLKIYPSELELQPEFKGFSDMLTSFEMYKGKRTGDETLDEKNISGVFKGAVKIYKWPPDGDEGDYVSPKGILVKDGVFSSFPDNVPFHYTLRIYCVRGINLQPKDLTGKCDPYLCVTIGERKFIDKANYVPSQTNPTFGRCIEFEACQFPFDNIATVSVWDFDTVTADDVIGETKIDVENRFYTKYRAHCGLPECYYESGFCRWRDQKKPSAILHDLCKTWGLDTPEYTDSCVVIGGFEFATCNFIPGENEDVTHEMLALSALKRWNEMPLVGYPLVPEHVETRSLYHPAKPGIEQGKIQLWVDVFPTLDLLTPPMVNIVPRTPVAYELRVIIWNTEDVILDEEDLVTGEKKSDIYVKGWLSDSQTAQYTDVHYRSLTGEGNFNWRFVFPFEYLASENKMVVHQKETVFSARETEYKIPCKLFLQVWDNDTFSKDDFLGAISFELNRMPRGARTSKKCDLIMLEEDGIKLNLFKVRRTKGWWPFNAKNPHTKRDMIKGKVEAELEIIEKCNAEKNPAGLGRQGPQGLPPPKRPDTSFNWFKNPLRSLKYCCCKVYKWKMICCCLVFLCVIFVLLILYALPGYGVKFILGV